MTDARQIETARLLLRPHTVADFADCAAMWADPEVTRYIGGRPFRAEEVWTRLLRYAGHWALLGYGYWAVIEKATGDFVGETGLADFHREMDPPLDRPEAGWVLASKAHGKGYGTEAVRAVLAWADARPAMQATVCLIHPENRVSMRVAEKCGYGEERRATYHGHTTTVLGRAARGGG